MSLELKKVSPFKFLFKFLGLTLILCMSTTLSCQGRTPSAHWPKECQANIDLKEVNTSDYLNDVPDKELSIHKMHSNPKFVAIVVHGLNLKPSRMTALEDLLQSNGAEILRVALLGHRGSLEEQKQVTWNQWLDQFHDHYCFAKERAKKLNIPLINLSYSLGALVSLGHIHNQEKWPYEKLIMIAPAAWIHWYGKIPGWFSFLGGGIGLPSKNLVEYRSQNTTSLAAYESMDHGRSEVENLTSRFLKRPTLIAIDPDDELVSLKKIKKFIKQDESSSWKVLELSNKKTRLKKSYHHLIIDEDSMGPKSWKTFSKELSSFLTGE